ncbi:hypothetical protein P152DRAFT_389663, partial [Eremomyces bilateralis CBS 781.70]
VYDGTCIMFRTMRDFGFLNQVRQSSAFCQTMAMSSWHLAHLRSSGSKSDHLRYSMSAVRRLQQQLDHPQDSFTDEAICAILAFACGANLVKDSRALNVHLDGLASVLRRRGGLQTLDTNPLLRVMLYWVDVNGSYIQDIVPRFLPPFHLVPSAQSIHEANLPPQTADTPILSCIHASDKPLVMRIHEAIKAAQTLMRTESKIRDLWSDTIFPGFHISPILHDLLSMHRPADGSQTALVTEVFRLGAILYITQLRGKFGIDIIPGRLYADKLRDIARSTVIEGRSARLILIWSLTVASVSSSLSLGSRTSFADLLKEAARTLDIDTYEDLRASVTQFLWDEELLKGQLGSLVYLYPT